MYDGPRQPAVYRVYDKDGRLIYIGASVDVQSRLVTHERYSWWHGLIAEVTTTDYPTADAALAAELVAIQEEQPAFNVRHTTNGPVLTDADAEYALAWRREPYHYFNSMALINRVYEYRLARDASAA